MKSEQLRQKLESICIRPGFKLPPGISIEEFAERQMSLVAEVVKQAEAEASQYSEPREK